MPSLRTSAIAPGVAIGDVEILETFLALLYHVLEAHELRAGFPGSFRRLALSKNEHSDFFTAAMRQRAGSTDHLIGLTRIHAKFERQGDGLIELGRRKLFERFDGLC